MHFPNVNITVEALFLLYSQEKCGAFFSYNLHKKIRVPHLWRKITWSIWDPSVFKMAAKSEFSKNHKKIRFVDISEISPERYITGHKETIESLKNRVNFPDSCPLTFLKLSSLCLVPQKYMGMLTHHSCKRVRKTLKISIFLVYERLPRFERGLREILWTIWRQTLSPGRNVLILAPKRARWL